jgi:ArsR family transcriptional regulator, arsenate/arsenite/antimonite-responsive transcriptional repressor
MIQPESLFNILSDPTRLRALMLLQSAGEVCVCELTFALHESQPKISRHLALMREAGIVESRRDGTWMHYRLSRKLPGWSTKILKNMHSQISVQQPYKGDMKRIERMTDRPGDIVCA